MNPKEESAKEHGVHDHSIYALSVDYDQRVLIIHTECPFDGPNKFIDIVFAGVVFEALQYSAFVDNSNILNDIDEGFDLGSAIDSIAELIRVGRCYGWPLPDFTDTADLLRKLAALEAKAYCLAPTCGLGGFVFATSIQFEARQRRYSRDTKPGAAPGRLPRPWWRFWGWVPDAEQSAAPDAGGM